MATATPAEHVCVHCLVVVRCAPALGWPRCSHVALKIRIKERNDKTYMHASLQMCLHKAAPFFQLAQHHFYTSFFGFVVIGTYLTCLRHAC